MMNVSSLLLRRPLVAAAARHRVTRFGLTTSSMPLVGTSTTVLVRSNVVPLAATPTPAATSASCYYMSSKAATQESATTTTATTSALYPTQPNDMFCRQCEQTADHFACVTQGVCGKKSETAAIQDALMEIVRCVSASATQLRAQVQQQQPSEAAAAEVPLLLKQANEWTLHAVFATVTNVNFDDESLANYVRQGLEILKSLQNSFTTSSSPSLNLSNDASLEEMEDFGHSVSLLIKQQQMGHADAFSLHEFATYALKGACAYAAHCQALENLELEPIYQEIHAIFADLHLQQDASNPPTTSRMHQTVLRVGNLNAQVLQLLDQGHAQLLGNPSPAPVRTTAVKGKCILVSGHDLVDLYHLLKQTEGSGIHVYTHGEMLPAHGYPKLRAFSHLKGNYGTAWQNQKFEFASFPGPILMTTNCVQEPRRVYKDRLYTINQVGVAQQQGGGGGSTNKHIQNRDFRQIIEHAQQLKGFLRTIEPAKFQTTGYNHRAVVPLLEEKLVPALQSGEISRILFIGGCDGSQWDRSYFTNLAEEAPDNTLILTMGCAKNRVMHLEKLSKELGNTGLPRVLDMGQCNDSYSALVVATELVKLLKNNNKNNGVEDDGIGDTVNDLPLSLAVSHMEQKAAAVLSTLLALGLKNVRVGPTMPAYFTPNVQSLLQKQYDWKATSSDYKRDLADMMEGK